MTVTKSSRSARRSQSTVLNMILQHSRSRWNIIHRQRQYHENRSKSTRNPIYSYIFSKKWTITHSLLFSICIFIYFWLPYSKNHSKLSWIKKKNASIKFDDYLQWIYHERCSLTGILVNKSFVIFVGVFIPMIILASSLADLSKVTNFEVMSDLIRDSAQVMYFSMTILGLLGFSTDIQLKKCRISLDMITIFIVALCCLIMSCKSISIIFKHEFMVKWQVMLAIDITANTAGFLYLAVICTKWVMGNIQDSTPADHLHEV
ncbi:hypothetical protein I4U23_025628 [Adineta vaga]|nr:hypothetical protein I4U23_025628 [Adineta vaga]